MSTSDEFDSASFFVGVFIGLLLGLLLFGSMMAFGNVDGRKIEAGIELCSANGGLAGFDRHGVDCKNGARFKYPEIG